MQKFLKSQRQQELNRALKYLNSKNGENDVDKYNKKMQQDKNECTLLVWQPLQ